MSDENELEPTRETIVIRLTAEIEQLGDTIERILGSRSEEMELAQTRLGQAEKIIAEDGELEEALYLVALVRAATIRQQSGRHSMVKWGSFCLATP